MKNKIPKRVLAGVLSLLMLISLIPLAVFADDTASTESNNLLEVLQDGGTYTLTDNESIEERGEISVANQVVIDLDGKELTLGEGKKSAYFAVDANESLTIKNGTIIASGEYAIEVKGGTLKLENVEFNNFNNDDEEIRYCDIYLHDRQSINVTGVLNSAIYVGLESKVAGAKVAVFDSKENAEASKENLKVSVAKTTNESVVFGEEINLNVDAESLCIPTDTITNTHVSLVLDGSIGLKFYFAYPTDFEYDTFNYMVDGSVETCTIGKISRENTAFIVSVPANMLDANVTVWFSNSSDESTDKSEKFTRSVQDYIYKVIEDYDKSDALRNLVEALGTYGKYAKAYKEYENSGKDSVDESDSVEISSSIEGYKTQVTKEAESVGWENLSLTLSSMTNLSVKFKFSWKNSTSKVDGYILKIKYTEKHADTKYQKTKTVEISEYANTAGFDGDGGEFTIDIAVPAAKLDEYYEVSICEKDSEGAEGKVISTIKLSPMCYIKDTLSAEGSSNALKNLVAALYKYNQAANIYFND